MQRTDERDTSATDVSLDTDVGGRSESSSGRANADASSRSGGPFAPKAFLGILLASVAGAVVGGSVPLVGVFGRFLGLFAVGFGVGLLSDRHRYLEVGLAGALVSGVLMVLSTLFSFFAPFALDIVARYGLVVAGAGAGGGLLAAVVGHYFGRDLREGLTREI